MQPIPAPEVLDPSRILDHGRSAFPADHEARAQLLDDALHQTCAYAQQLWHDLDALRGYLLDSLPPDPDTPGSHPTTSASPTGPDDDAGWNNWINAYATVTSVLCGPHGDSGFGLSEAHGEATLRRAVPVPSTQADRSDLGTSQHQTAALSGVTTERPPPPSAPHSKTGRAAGMTLLIALALRGLRPGRRR